MMRASLVAVAVAMFGCSAGTVGGNPFGSASDSMVPMEEDDDGDTDTDTGESSAGSSSGGISESWSSSGNDPSTGESAGSSDDGTTEAVSASSEGSSSSGGAEESSSSTGEPPPGGGQPAMGMYAHCYEMFFDNCAALPSCVYIIGEMNGFCTIDDCANPALDCDAAPGGSATPICLSDGVASSFCALDCSGGASCPTGMACESGSFDGVTTFNVCM